jgi:ribosomal protein S18 acetylase RimI-like enzyme
MPYQIRPAQPGDARPIAHVQVASWRTTYRGIVPDRFLDALDEEGRAESWMQQISDAAKCLLVAEDTDGIFGFVCGGAVRETAGDCDGELYAIYLLQESQRQGTGRALTRALADNLHGRGFKSMLAWVLEANPAVHFYQRLGALPVARKLIHIGGEDLPELALAWPSLDVLRTVPCSRPGE